VGAKVDISEFSSWGKFSKEQRTEERSWPAREPLMDTNHRSVILLDLLFLLGKFGDKGYIKASF